MQESAKYVIFKTKWGYFGLVGTESALYRSCLPGESPGNIKSRLLEVLPTAKVDKKFFSVLQEQIHAYFDGCTVEFDREIPVVLDGLTTFGVSVLNACRSIKLSHTTTYSGLAKKTGRPNASRAVGSVLARNPLPLIIPCHRVIRTDGGLGGFTAPGGISLKQRMLDFERLSILTRKA